MSKSAPNIDRSYLLAIIDGKIGVIKRFGAFSSNDCGGIYPLWGQSLPYQHGGSIGRFNRVRSNCSEDDARISHGAIIAQTQSNRDPQNREVKRPPAT